MAVSAVGVKYRGEIGLLLFDFQSQQLNKIHCRVTGHRNLTGCSQIKLAGNLSSYITFVSILISVFCADTHMNKRR